MTIEAVVSNMWWFLGIGGAGVWIISGFFNGLMGFFIGRITKK